MFRETYPLLWIGIPGVALYLVSLWLMHQNIITKKNHNYIWNSVLLIAFVLTFILGLLLSIQINYKLEIPFIKGILYYHVLFGIGLAFSGLFHLLWHIKYYIRIFKSKPKSGKPTVLNNIEEKIQQNSLYINDTILHISIFILGFVTIIIQLVFLNEFLAIFNGNELVVGIILTNWMLLTAFGAFAGRRLSSMKPKTADSSNLFIFLAISAIVVHTLLYIFKSIIFPTGTVTSLQHIFIFAIIALAPLCLTSGYMFTYLATLFSSHKQKNKISSVYAIESFGGIFGGVVFSFFLIRFLNASQSLGLAAFLLMIVSGIWKFQRMKVIALLVFVSSLIIFVSLNIMPVSVWQKGFLHPNQEIIITKDSPQGNLIKTRLGDQENIFLNNSLLYSSNNLIVDEEMVHYPLLQRKDAKRILVISGGTPGLFEEIIKYQPEEVTYIEINKVLLKQLRKESKWLRDSIIKTNRTDARHFLTITDEKFDIILVNLPAPDNFQINRFFTTNFLNIAKEHLLPGGLIRYCFPPAGNYMGDDALTLHSNFYATLKSLFKEVVPVTGENTYFMASDSTLTLEFTNLLLSGDVKTKYVNSYYIDDYLLKERSQQYLLQLNKKTRINSDFKPILFLNQIKYQLTQTSANYIIILICLGIVLIWALLKMNRQNFGIFVSGFTSSSIQLILLFVFQIVYGYLHMATGLFFALFMAGLSLGAYYKMKNPLQTINLSFIGFILITLILLLFIFVLSKVKTEMFSITLLTLFNVLIGYLTGRIFKAVSLVLTQSSSEIAAGSYSADLLGAAFGALLTASLFIPLFGFISSLILILVLNIIALGLFFKSGLTLAAK